MLSKYKEKGLIFNIQKFSIHDGDGMRTLIFMKGCPLSCLWCSNPESQSSNLEIMNVKQNCINCGKCYVNCKAGAITKDSYDIDSTRCNRCGECADKCYANAKKKIGTWYSVREIIEKIEKDYVIYRNSGGGVTVGGGEPLTQADFVAELLEACHLINIHTAIETCGCASWDRFEKVLAHTDQVFFDLKHMDSDRHKELTGVGNELILENAGKLAGMDKEVIFRIPLIPTLNDEKENLLATGEFVASAMNPDRNIKIEVLPYHRMGRNKYDGLLKGYTLDHIETPTKEYTDECREILQRCGCNVIWRDR